MVIATSKVAIRPQSPPDCSPFDHWTSPDGTTVAEFYRLGGHYLVRFPDRVDFEIDLSSLDVRCFAVDPDFIEVAIALWHNAIEPMLGNYRGQLHLHGSAVVIEGRGVAFVGLSRRGKSTLAAAFAQAGHPFLTEDVIAIRQTVHGTASIAPARAALRLFADSERQLFGDDRRSELDEEKLEIDASSLLPRAESEAPLAAIYVLGPGESEDIAIAPVTAQAALAELLQHSFILDVENKEKLKAHFKRCSDLALQTNCYRLDYPRYYELLPAVIESVTRHALNEWKSNARF